MSSTVIINFLLLLLYTHTSPLTPIAASPSAGVVVVGGGLTVFGQLTMWCLRLEFAGCMPTCQVAECRDAGNGFWERSRRTARCTYTKLVHGRYCSSRCVNNRSNSSSKGHSTHNNNTQHNNNIQHNNYISTIKCHLLPNTTKDYNNNRQLTKSNLYNNITTPIPPHTHTRAHTPTHTHPPPHPHTPTPPTLLCSFVLPSLFVYHPPHFLPPMSITHLHQTLCNATSFAFRSPKRSSSALCPCANAHTYMPLPSLCPVPVSSCRSPLLHRASMKVQAAASDKSTDVREQQTNSEGEEVGNVWGDVVDGVRGKEMSAVASSWSSPQCDSICQEQPQEQDECVMALRESELIERFVRGGGPGGQSVNKVASCVYLKHIPSGLWVKCRVFRSQSENREQARKILLGKLIAERDMDMRKEKREEINASRALGHRTAPVPDAIREKRRRDKARRSEVKRNRQFNVSKNTFI
eukprot:GHVQ01011541.1.p1 GENE.GHVQ01011541.1~~GHVQ01011541.1.p1  ORF type:complete len:466 (-),score=107.13 GHVQ01011541.1:874-2271(-)